MAANTLKYQHELSQNSCTLSQLQFKEQSRHIAFRWTFETIDDPRNFLPIYMLDKKRLREDLENGKHSCTRWALSFFETSEQAKARLEELMRKDARIYKKLGTHSSQGSLADTDGISEDCDSIGHYNHFEYADTELVSKFEVKDCIVTITNG